MTGDMNLVMREYEISKDNIKWVMGQLVTVVATLAAVAVVVFKLVFDGDPQHDVHTSFLALMLIILVNVVLAFGCYQNVQIIALQRHIHSLEVALQEENIFRWESKIARIWYGDNLLTLLFNLLVGLPGLCLVLTLYGSLGVAAGWPIWIWLVFEINILYAIALGICVKKIAQRVEVEIPLDETH